MQSTLLTVFPDLVCKGFVSGNVINAGSAFCVAVPEVEVVIEVSLSSVLRVIEDRRLSNGSEHRFRGLYTAGKTGLARRDPRKLHKAVLRVCTDLLVSSGALKFRRSAFNLAEPKVTLAAAVLPGVGVDIMVNSTTPLHNAALLTACHQIDPDTRNLMLLVKRWARDRGIAYASKGNLHPYAWNLLTAYFLQVGVSDGCALLPPLDASVWLSVLEEGIRNPRLVCDPVESVGSKVQVGVLFKDFVHFLNMNFEWHRECVSVRYGRRAPPNAALSLHLTTGSEGNVTAIASIEDPFDVTRNLSDTVDAVGLARIQEEVVRAAEIFSRGGSLSELLEPWTPSRKTPAPGDAVTE
jgi:hypothetical protein